MSKIKPSSDKVWDLVIIGAGPSGLAAAMYAAREGMEAAVLEKSIVGGLAAITDQIDNYPGFENGVSGLDLSDHLLAHAKRFEADIQTGITVNGLKQEDARIRIKTTKTDYVTRTVLIVTGSTYKLLGVPGEAELIGRGVHFCATCDGPIYRGRELVVVGGGNSSMQESLFLARYAKHLTILVRGPELGGTQILREQVQLLPNATFVYNTSITAITGQNNKLVAVEAYDKLQKKVTHYPTDGVFVFIGLNANTEAFASTIELDDQRFVKTGPDFATNMPGVYAAGDVRSGSTWQIASAIGEGVSATLKIREYLQAQKHHERHTSYS